jgi:hypothetical protein
LHHLPLIRVVVASKSLIWWARQDLGTGWRGMCALRAVVYSASSSVSVSISNGDVASRRHNLLADFNSGVDPRGALASAHGATSRGITNGWSSTINWWDVVSAADRRNGFVDYKFDPSTHDQDWKHFQALRVHTKLAGQKKSAHKDYQYQVSIRDREQGHTPLGKCKTGVCDLSLTSLADHKRDSIMYILIRVHIGFFSELDTVGAFQRVHLYSTTLV